MRLAYVSMTLVLLSAAAMAGDIEVGYESSRSASQLASSWA